MGGSVASVVVSVVVSWVVAVVVYVVVTGGVSSWPQAQRLRTVKIASVKAKRRFIGVVLSISMVGLF